MHKLLRTDELVIELLKKREDSTHYVSERVIRQKGAKCHRGERFSKINFAVIIR